LIIDLLLVVAPSGKIIIGALPFSSFSFYLSSICFPTAIFSSFVPALSKNTQSIAVAIIPTNGYYFILFLDTKLGKNIAIPIKISIQQT
jgi:hypothetical protein